MNIEHLGFFYLATPTATSDIRLYGHLRGPVTYTPVAERLAVELSLPDLMN